MPKRIAALLLALLLVLPSLPVAAQTATPSPGPAYVVQPGDTLWSIAILFNVSLTDLQAANALSSSDIFPGNRLIIPGLEGLNGTLVTKPVPFGETFRSLSRQYQPPCQPGSTICR